MPLSARLASLTGAFALVLLAQACAEKPADTAAADTTATMAAPMASSTPPELTARSTAMLAAWNQEDGAAAAAFFTDSAIVIVDDSTYSGKAAIRDGWIVPGLPMVSDVTVSDQTFTGSGTSMTETGRFSETLTLPGEAPAPNAGTYSAEWTNMNGIWMVSRFTVKSDKPAT
jgi:ketosteroid isomerase-like protein